MASLPHPLQCSQHLLQRSQRCLRHNSQAHPCGAEAVAIRLWTSRMPFVNRPPKYIAPRASSAFSTADQLPTIIKPCPPPLHFILGVKSGDHKFLFEQMETAFSQGRVHQVQQLCDPLFKAAWEKAGSKRLLWDDVRALFRSFGVASLSALYAALAAGFVKSRLELENSS
jgi:hypothetical protein